MSSEIEARYLTIDWQSEGVARAIEVAPVPLEIESCTKGGFAVESTIFNDFHPWLGIRLGAGLEEMVPVFVTASGQETPLLQVADPRGGGFWWLRNDGWDHAGKRHLSELQRSPGIYNIRIGDVMLRVENRLSAFGRADIQAYVDDFRGDLLWMIMNDVAGATATGKGAGAGPNSLKRWQSCMLLRKGCWHLQLSPSGRYRRRSRLRSCTQTRRAFASMRAIQQPAS